MQRRGDLFGKHLLGGKICEHRTFVLEGFDLRSQT